MVSKGLKFREGGGDKGISGSVWRLRRVSSGR
jgi:hypothetical protein